MPGGFYFFLRVVLPILRRRNAKCFLEQFGEAEGILKAKRCRDDGNRQFCRAQQAAQDVLLGLLRSDHLEMFQRVPDRL